MNATSILILKINGKCNCICSIDATSPMSGLLLLPLSSAILSPLHVTGGRCGSCVVILVPFVDIFHGYFDLYLLHIFGRQVAYTALGYGIRLRASSGATGARCQPLLLLCNGRQQRLVPVL